MLTGKQWLVISPHCDDAELGCGGAMARATAQGIGVHVVVACAKGEHHPHNGSDFTSGEVRAAELAAALGLIGASHDIVYRMDKGFDFDLCSTAKSQFVSRLDAAITRLRPDTVLLPVPSFHQEHQWVYECAIAACRTTRYPSPVRNVYAYEYPAANWGPSAGWDPARGGMYVDVSEHLVTKLAMLAEHASQMYRGQDALISLEAVKALARYRGIEAGVTAAELLYLLRGTA